jgi:hypothetical protein
MTTGKNFEERLFAHLRQADYANFHSLIPMN